MRHTLAAAALLAAAGTSLGKPPGLTDPRVEGKEPPPVARDYYQVESKPACSPPAPPTAAADFWAAMRRVLPTLFAR